MRVCIVGASGKLGRYLVQHALDRGYEVVGVCRAQSVGKLDVYRGRITIVPGATSDRRSSGAQSRAAMAYSSCSSRGASIGTPPEPRRRFLD